MDNSSNIRNNSERADAFQQQGVIVGVSVKNTPAAPARHTLNDPVKVSKLPIHQLPTLSERFSQKIRQFVLWLFTGRRAYNEEDVRKAYDAIIMIILAVTPDPSTAIRSLSSRNHHFRRQLRRFEKRRASPKQIRHPYDLLFIFDFLPQLRGPLLGEKYIIELYCSLILSEYINLVRRQIDDQKLSIETKFTFAGEAVQYFRDGHNIEQQLDKVTHPRERVAALKLINELYFHAKWYYVFSVLSREPTIDEGKLFMRAYHAMFFMARLDETNSLLREPKRASLPKRSFIKFLTRRDNSVRQRVGSDQVFAKTVADILKYLPSH